MHSPTRLLADLVDLPRLQRMCESFSAAGDSALAVLDPDGAVLVAAGWQDICTAFHRREETTLAGRLESDLQVNRRIVDGLADRGRRRRRRRQTRLLCA